MRLQTISRACLIGCLLALGPSLEGQTLPIPLSEAISGRAGIFGKAVGSMAFTDHDSALLVVDEDGRLERWRVDTATPLAERHLSSRYSTAADHRIFEPLSHGTRVALVDGSEIVTLDPVSYEEIHRWPRPEGIIKAIAFDSTGETVAVALDDGQICYWRTETAHIQPCRSAESSREILALAVDAKGQFIAAGSWNHIVIWDLESDVQIHLREELGIQRLAFSPMGPLAIGSSTGGVYLWDRTGDRRFATLEGHTAAVTDLQFDPHGRLLATGSKDGSVKLWYLPAAIEIATLDGHRTDVTALAFDSEGYRLASGEADGTIHLWAVASGREIWKREPHGRPVRSLAFSGGMLWALVPDRPAIHGWDIDALSESSRFSLRQLELDDARDPPTAIALSHDTSKLAVGTRRGRLVLWTKEGVQAGTGPYFDDKVHNGPVEVIAFDASGELFATGAGDRAIKLWTVEGKSRVRQLEAIDSPGSVNGRHHDSNITALLLTEDGRLVSGSRDLQVKLWSLETGRIVARSSFDSEISALGLHDGHFVVLAGAELFRWDPGEPPVSLATLEAKPLTARFAPSGEYLAIASSRDGLIELLRLGAEGDHRIEKQLLAGARGTWVACSMTDECRYQDDGSLALRTDDDGRLHSLVPNNPYASGLEILDLEPKLVIRDGVAEPLRLTIANSGHVRARGLHFTQSNARDQLVLHHPEEVIDLGPGELRPITLPVSWNSAYERPRSESLELSLKLEGLNLETPQALPTITVETSAPRVSLDSFDLVGHRIELVLKNHGPGAIDSASVTLELDGREGGPRLGEKVSALQAGRVVPVTLELPEDISSSQRANVRIALETDTLPPHLWTFDRPLRSSSFLWLIAGLIGLVVGGGVVYYRWNQKDPLVRRLTEQPEELLALELNALPRTIESLGKLGRLNSILAVAKAQPSWLEHAVDFARAGEAKERYELLVRRLGLEPERKACNPEETLWLLKLNNRFPLNLDTCFLFFPGRETTPDEALKYLENRREVEDHVAIVISPKVEHQEALEHETSVVNQWAAPSMRQLTELFLSHDPLIQLAEIITEHVPLTRISPYQLRGGVNKPALFFGRGQMLANIAGRAPANYLLVGGRQVGKSSLLKAVVRQYERSSDVDCRYIVLSDRDLLRRLARELGIQKKRVDMYDISQKLREKKDGRFLILFDEADVFIKHDRRAKFELLYRLRSLSEEGHAHFIFAGFWQLYDAAVLDYQSPLKNFGDTLTIAALEPAACRQLATEPMAMMKVRYESDELVDRLIEETGQRANLISIACSELIERLNPEDRVIRKDDLDEVLKHRRLIEALSGWDSLGGASDEAQNRIDRVLIYATVERDEFTLRDAFQIFDDLGKPIEPKTLTRSLGRLELAFVLRKDDDTYSYQVPLFRRWIRHQDPEELLRREVERWSDHDDIGPT